MSCAENKEPLGSWPNNPYDCSLYLKRLSVVHHMFCLEEQLQLELVKDTFILIQWKSNWLGSLLASDQLLGVSWTKSVSVRFFFVHCWTYCSSLLHKLTHRFVLKTRSVVGGGAGRAYSVASFAIKFHFAEEDLIYKENKGHVRFQVRT